MSAPIPPRDQARATHFVRASGWVATPYSQPAATHGKEAVQEEFDERGLGDASLIVGVVLDAAHDREALGLGASVCARTYRAELLNEITAAILDTDEIGVHTGRGIVEFLTREFGDQP